MLSSWSSCSVPDLCQKFPDSSNQQSPVPEIYLGKNELVPLRLSHTSLFLPPVGILVYCRNYTYMTQRITSRCCYYRIMGNRSKDFQPFLKELGTGQFGVVKYGKWRSQYDGHQDDQRRLHVWGWVHWRSQSHDVSYSPSPTLHPVGITRTVPTGLRWFITRGIWDWAGQPLIGVSPNC